MTGVSKLLVQEFYTNAAVSDEEVANAGQLPYKRFVRGVVVDFSSENIRRVMRFKAETQGAKTNYRTREATDQRLDEVLADLCISGATWSGKGHLIHAIMRGEDMRAEDIIADNMAVIAQGLHVKGNLSKDAGVPLREFRKTSKIPEEKLITAKRMESTRIPRIVPAQQQDDDDEDEPMPQVGGGNEEEEQQ
ncbi:hypothetical protein PIB30_084088 [Stylosanthes scabra]|uniref:Uncharacterized protein n=1 Tax=Stylosanthes scabra TaxID=79078 RepID=A0ABU6RT90_9FABA|nr:hypothetical protein [Stylosanthes scabra]